jgi:hypothetical protein
MMGILPRVYAGFSPSELTAATGFDRSTDLDSIRKILEAKAIGERLKQLGFSTDEVKSRLEQLSDKEIHELALQVDELEVGGGGEGLVIVLLVVALVVVLFFWLSEYRLVLTK